VITFVEVLPAYYGDESLPTCPDGSGDLWWDEASYIRYQTWDGPSYRPESIVHHADSPNYCNGPVVKPVDPWGASPF